MKCQILTSINGTIKYIPIGQGSIVLIKASIKGNIRINRYGIAIAFLLLSTILYFCGWFWPWGWVLGTVLLFFADLPDRL